MSQDNLITLYNKEADEHVTTRVNKKKMANASDDTSTTKGGKISLKKYSKKLRKRVVFTQTKKLFKKK